MSTELKGRVHSFQSLGTVDGPGVRFVVFMQGCNLRCKCCHNPDTWDMSSGELYTVSDIMSRVIRYREYFGNEGGITLSGGEPLLQAEFASRLFEQCHSEGINTCLDTSGSIINDDVKNLLCHTDRVLLDIKYTSNALYNDNVGCPMSKPLEFLNLLNDKNIPVTIRQVIIPTINDNEDNIKELKRIVASFPVADKIELLPFRKICQTKYDNMQMNFPFAHIPEADAEIINRLKQKLN